MSTVIPTATCQVIQIQSAWTYVLATYTHTYVITGEDVEIAKRRCNGTTSKIS